MYSYANSVPYSYYVEQGNFMAGNRFTAKERENISAIGFYTFSQNISYEIWLDKIVNGKITQAKTKVTSGTLAQGGYHTINLAYSIEVDLGEEFIVWLKLSGDAYYGVSNSSLANGNSYIQMSSGTIQNSAIAFAINAYSKGVDYSNYVTISSVTPNSDEISPKEAITITFSDDISKGSDFSKISLKDEQGEEVQKSVTISGKNLIINEIPESYLYSKLTLYIPKAAVQNSQGQYMYNDYTKEYNVYPAANTVVTFKDTALESAVRSKLGKSSGDITAGDMRTLEELDLSSEGIINLSGLEYAAKLKVLNLSYNEIISIKPLSTLNSLQKLYLQSNSIKDISPLSNLINLKELNISYNSIRDISVISNMPSLYSLNIAYNLVNDISPLEKLYYLQIINISNNFIKDISPLKKLVEGKKTSYVYIYLYNNYIDFTVGSSASDILNSFAYLSIYCSGQDDQFKPLQVGAINNKRTESYYSTEIMTGESIVLEYDQPISLASNANSLVSLQAGFTTLDFNLRVVDNALIVTPLKTDYKSSYLYLTIGEGAVKSQSNSNATNDKEEFFIYAKEELYGDVDSNGIVDLVDFAAIASSYNGMMEIDSKWNFKKDLNRDGIIDLYDLTIAPHTRVMSGQ